MRGRVCRATKSPQPFAVENRAWCSSQDWHTSLRASAADGGTVPLVAWLGCAFGFAHLTRARSSRADLRARKSRSFHHLRGPSPAMVLR